MNNLFYFLFLLFFIFPFSIYFIFGFHFYFSFFWTYHRVVIYVTVTEKVLEQIMLYSIAITCQPYRKHIDFRIG